MGACWILHGGTGMGLSQRSGKRVYPGNRTWLSAFSLAGRSAGSGCICAGNRRKLECCLQRHCIGLWCHGAFDFQNEEKSINEAELTVFLLLQKDGESPFAAKRETVWTQSGIYAIIQKNARNSL